MVGLWLLQPFCWCTVVLAASWLICSPLVALCCRCLRSRMLFLQLSGGFRCWLFLRWQAYVGHIVLGRPLPWAAVETTGSEWSLRY